MYVIKFIGTAKNSIYRMPEVRYYVSLEDGDGIRNAVEDINEATKFATREACQPILDARDLWLLGLCAADMVVEEVAE